MNQQAKILPAAEREAPVLAASSYIGDAIGVLDSALAELIHRLTPVLSPPTKLAGKEEAGESASAVSDLATALTEHARTVEVLIRVVREVTERVEL